MEFRNPNGTFFEPDCEECEDCTEAADCSESRRNPPLCWLREEDGRLVLPAALSSGSDIAGEAARLGAAKTIELRALLGSEKLGTGTEEADDGGRVWMGENTRGASETEEPIEEERTGVELGPSCWKLSAGKGEDTSSSGSSGSTYDTSS